MSHRIERIASIVREVVSDAILNRLADPRICRFTSVTRVAVSPDLQTADVHVSVMGSESDARRTMHGLGSARGTIQSLLARRLDLRRCPILRFHLDPGIKKGFQIVTELDRLEAQRAARQKDPGEPPVAPDSPHGDDE